MSNELTDTIKTSAQGPKSAASDGVSMQQHPLPEQIAAAKFLASQEAAKKGLGIRKVKLVPPGIP